VTAEDPMMVGAATVFVVTDIAKSTEHYRDVLDFTVTFEYGTPTFNSDILCVPVSGRSCLAAAFGKPNEPAIRQWRHLRIRKGCRFRLRRIGGARSQDRKATAELRLRHARTLT
jgi:hypothetical protein